MSLPRKVLLSTIVVLILSAASATNEPGFHCVWTDPGCPLDYGEVAEYLVGLEECTSVIVTGSAAKNGRAILMKNRDSSEIPNRSVYQPATEDTYAFVAVNSMWMGINEKGLAVMNTAMLPLAESADAGESNGLLNRMILEICQNVSDVETKLEDPESAIGPTARMSGLSVATCIGVIDKLGKGAFFEISNSMISVEHVINTYQSRANHPRTFPGLASGPDGRDQYALDALEAVNMENGEISWEDVAQNVSRHVRDKELGGLEFDISGEMCNDYTVSAMVSVSGDSRYDGKLNAMWCEYGRVPMVGVFLPSMVASGDPPSIVNSMVSYTQEKREYAEGAEPGTYRPARVREIQEYAFAAESYTFDQYDRLSNLIKKPLRRGTV
ncbi:MAG: carcinine hydrolase/isopenicillin-N N-acyltransferase family protein [Candidatus Thorarchaeota archaeon]